MSDTCRTVLIDWTAAMAPHLVRRQPPRSLRNVLGRAVAIPLAFLVGFGVTFAIVSQLGGRLAVDPAPTEAPTSIDPVADLIARHDCWQDDAPADMSGKLPGHVVVTRPGASAPLYAGAVMVGRALDHVFEGRHPRLTVHAFCR